jgi:diguanylate cyclase (GGDEF)-like protein
MVMEKVNTSMKKPYALIVVDDLDIASLDFRQTLDSVGYMTELVLHNHINVEQIAQIHPNIIFTHFSLPEISGLEVLKEIREDERLNNIPVVGLVTYKEVATNLCTHVDTVLLRPVSHERLANLLSLLSSVQPALEKNPWDALTGLFSPSFFTTRLQQVLKHSQDVSENQFMVFSINLDQLMKYEKKFGKEYRMQILLGVAKVLKKVLRSSDVVTRFEENLFLILIENAVDRFAPTSIADRMQMEFEDYLVSVGLKNRIKVSIGGIYCTADYKTTDEVLRDVRYALNQAKRDKKNGFLVYDRKTLPSQAEGARTLVEA